MGKALYRLGIVQLADEEWEEARHIFEKINLFAPEEKHIDKVFEHISFMEDSADLVDFPDLYQKFVGRYWVEEFANFQIDMIDINGFLFAYPTSQSKMAMYALSPYKYSTFQGFDIEFIPDEEGNVVKARMYEDKNPPFYALRIEPEVEAIFDAFKAEKFEEIESRLETFADRYPYIPTLKKMKTHIEFQAAPEYSPDAYKDLVGKYEMGKLSCEISLKEGKPYFELFGLPVFQDAFRMYEIAPEVFMNLAALNGEIKIQREKGKVSGIELTLSGKSGGLKMKRIM
ncbi:MAG: hypothetical protein R3B93_18545 [Bacteroidia bacterium]